jgi:1-acyl-sn-glycerol-3-phosphate acyltransferase
VSVPSGLAPVWDYRLFAAYLRLIFRVRGREVSGLENLPETGAVIVAANHVSLVDPPFIGSTMELVRHTRYLAKGELFRLPVVGWVLRRWGVIPVDRARGDVGAVRRAVSVLRQEGCILVFPEGTRSRGGIPGRPKSGVSLLARESGARVVPARVWDTDRWLGPGKIRLRFGRPFRYDEDGSREGDRRFAERVMREILSLQAGA